MKSETTVIEGITVEVETWTEDGAPRSTCFLSRKDQVDGAYFQGSIQLCEHEGGIPWNEGGREDGKTHWPVSDRTLEKIEEWAVRHGY